MTLFSRTAGKGILVAVFVFTGIFCPKALSALNQADKQQVVSQVAGNWIEVAKEQYSRGFYKAAEQSLSRAKQYQGYLSQDQQDMLEKLLQKTRRAAAEQQRINKNLDVAGELMEQGKLKKAKAVFEQVRDSEFLTEQQRQSVGEKIEEITAHLSKRIEEINEIYKRSVGFYRAGELEKARDGFIEVAKIGLLTVPEGKTAEDYLVKIDGILSRQSRGISDEVFSSKLRSIAGKPKGGAQTDNVNNVEAGIINVAEPLTDDIAGSGKDEIVQSYARAVLADAKTKVQQYITSGDFNKAQQSVVSAQQRLDESKASLGDEPFQRYSSLLEQLGEQIAQASVESSRQLEEQKRLEKMRAQRRLAEGEKSKKIDELMNKTSSSLENKSYEEAIEYLQRVLVVLRGLAGDKPAQ